MLLLHSGIASSPNREKAIAEAEKILYRCLKNGLSFKVSQGNVVQLCPPLIIKKEELLKAIAIIDEAISALV